LLLVLHGFKSSPAEIEMYLKPRRLADKFGYVLLLPHGNLNQNGNYYWNATKDCCAYDSAAIDDSSYLLSLVKEAIDRYAIDPQRVYGIGFSNGGYMMYRLACEDKGLFKGMGIIAGLSFKDPRACTQPTPRTIVHIHGTADEIVPVDAHNREASTLTPLLKRWSERNGCPNASPARRSRLNLTKSVEGPDTDHLVWHDCQEAGLHYFQINDASHTPWYHQSPIHQIWPLLDQKSTTEQPTNRATTQSEAR
jgi:polyhydroxybutyrate depolymerase